jgi:hypothetical protein
VGQRIEARSPSTSVAFAANETRLGHDTVLGVVIVIAGGCSITKSVSTSKRAVTSSRPLPQGTSNSTSMSAAKAPELVAVMSTGSWFVARTVYGKPPTWSFASR